MITELSSPIWPIKSTRTQLARDDETILLPLEIMTNHHPDPKLLIDADDLIKAIDRIAPPKKVENRNLPAELRLLTAWLEDMDFSEVSIVVGIAVDNLRKILHGTLPLNKSKCPRIERVLEMTRRLRTIIAEEDVGRWYRTSDPALNDMSPIEALKKQKIAEVERVVESYFDPSYA